jgi:hypothetical protein
MDCIETGVEAWSEGTGIDSEEAKGAPLSPNCNHGYGDSEKFGDNSARKNDPGPERLRSTVYIRQSLMDCIETGVEAWSEGTGIDSGEAKRAPLSPNCNHGYGDSEKFGDNSDRKNNPGPERLRSTVYIRQSLKDCIETGVEAWSEGTGIDSEEAKRAPLSPNFNHE